MLESGDREYVKAQLLAQVASDTTPRQTLISFLPADVAMEVEEGLKPQVLVERVLVLCEQDGWRRTPPLLSTLIAGLLGDSGRIPELIARLATPPRAPAAPDPFSATVLDTGQPFLDRLATRSILKTWTELMPLQQVMVVEGPSGTGKTYTNEYVRHLVRHVVTTSADVRTVLVAFDREQAASVGPREVAKDLVWNMGGDPDEVPEADTNAAALVKQLVSWVFRTANKDGLRWWFVLDGFRSSRPLEVPGWQLREDTREFVVTFVRGLTNGINAARHRLLLPDFERALLPLPPGSVGLDKTCSVPKASIRSLIEAVIAAAGSDLDPDAVETQILNGLSNPVAELPELNARLIDLMEVA